MFKNMASAIFLTEHQDELATNKPKVKGRIITTIEKAKEIRPMIEKCITIARRSLAQKAIADSLNTKEERDSAAWKKWREGEGWKKWSQAVAPVLAARRRVAQLLGNKLAAKICFEEIAPRFAERPGGYTRILRLAKPRLGDAGTRAILEFVGVHDRVVAKSEKPAFTSEE
jgi:large subunit ribosomal protein L17